MAQYIPSSINISRMRLKKPRLTNQKRIKQVRKKQLVVEVSLLYKFSMHQLFIRVLANSTVYYCLYNTASKKRILNPFLTMYTLTYVLISIVADVVSGYGSGAPPISCVNMSPGHLSSSPVRLPITRQAGPSPYTLTATVDKQSKEVRLTVGGKKVSGFLIQGRSSKSGPAIGKFTENSVANYQNCLDQKV